MKVSAVSLVLVVLTGCLQPVAPTQSVKNVRPSATAAIERLPKLKLSVEVSPRTQAIPGVWVTTCSITNLGHQPVVIGDPTGIIHLDLTAPGDDRVGRFQIGVFGFTIDVRQTVTFTVELPASFEPGLYQFSMWIEGRPERSPPFIVRLLPRADVLDIPSS